MRQSVTRRPVRVGLISLGCAKNLVDAEIMLGTLLQHGLEITNDASQADVVIINTCSFIDSAQQESVDTILESAALRDAQNRRQALVVAGCLPQRFRLELPKLLPEVDAFMGLDQVTDVAEILRHALARRAARIRETADERRRKNEEGRTKKVTGQRAGLTPGREEPKSRLQLSPVLRLPSPLPPPLVLRLPPLYLLPSPFALRPPPLDPRPSPLAPRRPSPSLLAPATFRTMPRRVSG